MREWVGPSEREDDNISVFLFGAPKESDQKVLGVACNWFDERRTCLRYLRPELLQCFSVSFFNFSLQCKDTRTVNLFSMCCLSTQMRSKQHNRDNKAPITNFSMIHSDLVV